MIELFLTDNDEITKEYSDTYSSMIKRRQRDTFSEEQEKEYLKNKLFMNIKKNNLDIKTIGSFMIKCKNFLFKDTFVIFSWRVSNVLIPISLQDDGLIH